MMVIACIEHIPEGLGVGENFSYSEMWSNMDSELEDNTRKCGLKWHTALPGCQDAPAVFSPQSIGYLLSDKKISINVTLHFDVIVRQVMARGLSGTIQMVSYTYTILLCGTFFPRQNFPQKF